MIDKFRLVAALLVIAIHTAPFASVDESLDYVLTYGVGRIAVPFFPRAILEKRLSREQKVSAISEENRTALWRMHTSLCAADVVCQETAGQSVRRCEDAGI